MVFRLLHWASRLFLAAIFIYAGYTKVDNSLQFAASIETYQLFPPSMVILAVRILPWLEILLGLVLLSGIFIRYASLSAAGLLVFFIAIMALTYFRGIEADCGCFGVGEKISAFTLMRDALIILPALYLWFQPWIEKRGWRSR